MPDVNSQLSQKLKELRGQRSLYRVEQDSGISRSLLRRYESGKIVPEEQMLKRLATFYELDFSELRKLQFADRYPQGSELRQALFEWVNELQKK